MASQVTPMGTVLRHKHAFSSSLGETDAAQPNLPPVFDFAISIDGKATLERRWTQGLLPSSSAPRESDVGRARNASSVQHEPRRTGRHLFQSNVTPSSSRVTPTLEPPEITLPAAARPTPLLPAAELPSATSPPGSPVVSPASEPGSTDLARVLLQTYTFASPSPVRKKRRSASLVELPSSSPVVSGPLAMSTAENLGAPIPGWARGKPSLAVPVKDGGEAKRSLTRRASSSSMRLAEATQSTTMPAKRARTTAETSSSRLSTRPSMPLIILPAATDIFSSLPSPPPSPSDLLTSLQTLLASSHLLSSGWIPALSLLVIEGESALAGHSRGPSQIAECLRLGEEVHRTRKLEDEARKLQEKKRKRDAKGSRGAGKGVLATSSTERMPAVQHPAYPSSTFTWVMETGLEPSEEGEGDDDE